MSGWLQRDWCSSFVLALGHFLWQGMLIAVVLAIGLRTAKSVSARYWLAVSALVFMAACPIGTFCRLMQSVYPVVPSEPAPIIQSMVRVPSLPLSDVLVADATDFQESAEELPVGSDRLAAASDQISMPLAMAKQLHWWQAFAPQLTSLYLTGVSLLLLRLIVGLWGGRRLRRQAIPVTDATLLAALQRQGMALRLKILPFLAYCEQVTVPTLIGVFKPMILLPLSIATGLSPEQIESVLAHEMAHLQRYDHLMNLCQRVIESFLFFHPAVWWVSRRVREEREHCCDDLVVACGILPLEYAESLLRVAELGRHAELQRGAGQRRSFAITSLLATGDRPSTLRQRIARLLGYQSELNVRAVHPWLLGGITVVCLGTVWTLTAMTWMALAENSRLPSEAADPNGEYIAELPDGLKVKFVGMTSNAARAENGWRPDGSKMGDVPDWPRGVELFGDNVSGTRTPTDKPIDSNAYDFLFEFQGLRRQPSFNFDLPGDGAAYVHDPVSEHYRLRVSSRLRDQTRLRSDDVRVGMTDEPWGKWVQISATGEILNPLGDDDLYRSSYSQIQFQRVERSRDDPGRTVLVLRHPRRHGRIHAFELRAFVTHGEERRDFGSQVRDVEGIDMGESEWGIGPFPDGQKIARFEYRLRPFRHWVTFKDVSLQPGTKTDVKVFVKSLSDADGFGLPRDLVDAKERPANPAQPTRDETSLLHEQLKQVLPMGWTVYRQNRAFGFRGPKPQTEPSKTEEAKITLWFADSFAYTDVLDHRDPKLPRIDSWGPTRIGQALFTRNAAAVELWPEFLGELYWLLPVDHAAFAGITDLNEDRNDQYALNRMMLNAGTRIDVRIDDDGRRIYHMETDDFLKRVEKYGLSRSTRFLVIGNLPDPADAKTDEEKQRALRHEAECESMRKGAREYGIRILSLADYDRYLRQLTKDGRANDWHAVTHGNRIRIPEVPIPVNRGKVVRSELEIKVVWIGLGEADHVKLGMKFEVREIETNENRGQPPVIKGTVEVTRILAPHLAEAKIIDQQNGGPVKDDDVIRIDEVPRAALDGSAAVLPGDDTLFLTIGKGQKRLLEFEEPLTRVDGHDPKIASVKAVEKNKLSVEGLKVGITILTITDRRDTEFAVPVEVIESDPSNPAPLVGDVFKPRPRANPLVRSVHSGQIQQIGQSRTAIVLGLNEVRLVGFPNKVIRVDGYSPQVIEVTAVETNTLRLRGISLGTTTAIVEESSTTKSGNAPGKYTIDVEVISLTRESVRKLFAPNDPDQKPDAAPGSSVPELRPKDDSPKSAEEQSKVEEKIGDTHTRLIALLPDWMKPLNGKGLLADLDENDDVVAVTISRVTTDEMLSQLKTLPKLRELHIDATQEMTPGRLARLAGLQGLKTMAFYSINQDQTGLDNEAFRNLVENVSLRELRAALPNAEISYGTGRIGPITTVTIEGNTTIPVSEIAKYLKTRPGRPVTQQQIRDDVDALVRTRWFAVVEPVVLHAEAGSTLVFRLLERPIVTKVEYRGNKKIKQKVFDNMTQLMPGQPYDPSVNRECVRRIQEYYKEKGYPFATVELERGDENRDPECEVIFVINEGPKVRVTKVTFDGNTVFSDQVLQTKTQRRTRILSSFSGKYDPATISDDIETIREYYHSLGYFDVKITPEQQFADDKATVAIHYDIDEGVRYKINNVSFAGNNVLNDEDIRKMIKVEDGDAYNKRHIIKDQEALMAKYGELGRPFASVTPVPRWSEEPGVLDIVYKIDEDKVYRIRNLKVDESAPR